MDERVPWSCKECGTVLGWQGSEGLEVNPESIERFTLPSLAEEIWVTCKQCGAVQIWRAQPQRRQAGGRWRTREKADESEGGIPPRRRL